MQSATALERHAGFFDPEGTGSVTIGQTYAGLRSLGVGLGWRLVLPLVINGFLGYLTHGKLSLVIAVPKIVEGKHPFDTGVFGDDGQIDEAAFAELSEVVHATVRSVTADELQELMRARVNRRP